MEISSSKWLSEVEMVDPIINYQYQINPFEFSPDELDFHSYSPEVYSNHTNFNDQNLHNFGNPPLQTPQTSMERPAKQLKTIDWRSCTTDQLTSKATSSSSSHLITFENSNSPLSASEQFYGMDSTVKPKTKAGSNGSMNFGTLISRGYYDDQYCSPKQEQGRTKKAGELSRSPLHARDHVIAERKRREKLSEQFVALSAVVPGLKKMDKVTVLENAAKYLKQLQEKVKMLEEQTAKKATESVVLVKKSRLFADNDSFSSDENFDCYTSQPLPEIGVRVSEKDVLIRIHCEKHKGCMGRILSEIEKLHLNVVNSNVLAFGISTLDITVVSQMDVKFSMSVKELAINLRQALLKVVI